MEILWTILIGLAVGVVAKLLMPGDDPGGLIITIFLGIAGAFVARWIGQAAGWYGPTESAGFLASVGGAVVLLIIYRLLFGRRRRVSKPTGQRLSAPGLFTRSKNARAGSLALFMKECLRVRGWRAYFLAVRLSCSRSHWGRLVVMPSTPASTSVRAIAASSTVQV
jgi:uncharacterized membrane protein YeaQ/YmgE (transglycosylase-associated protein family)